MCRLINFAAFKLNSFNLLFVFQPFIEVFFAATKDLLTIDINRTFNFNDFNAYAIFKFNILLMLFQLY